MEEVRAERGSDVIIVLVGNKTDLVDKRQVGGMAWAGPAGVLLHRRAQLLCCLGWQRAGGEAARKAAGVLAAGSHAWRFDWRVRLGTGRKLGAETMIAHMNAFSFPALPAAKHTSAMLRR